VLDVGGGDSRLVDYLLARGSVCVKVLDISAVALTRAQARLGTDARRVEWIEADVTGNWPVPSVDIWHDRAVFHFLTAADDRARYRAHLHTALRPGGSVIMATFGPDGPTMCSGLPARRYSPEALEAELGEPFTLRETGRELHLTPSGTTQEFWYSRFVLEA
jgi:SAM-dependent methyltransferase